MRLIGQVVDGKDARVILVRVQVEGLKRKGRDVGIVNFEDEIHVGDGIVHHDIGHDAVYVEVSSFESIVYSHGTIACVPRGIMPCSTVGKIQIWMKVTYVSTRLTNPPLG